MLTLPNFHCRVLGALLSSLLLASTCLAASKAERVTQALTAIADGASESHSDAVLVIRDDEVLLERYGEHGAQPIELMSATKSVVALAIGALIDDGRIASLDQPVHVFYPEWKQGQKEAITLRMLLDHTSGLQNVLRPAVEIYPAPDVIRLALAAELSHAPGTHVEYNNKAVNLLAGVIERAAGEPMDGYVQRRLLDPLGARYGEWYRDRAGNPHAMAGLSLDARGAAAIGQLVLDHGMHQGQRLVSKSFIDEMLAPSHLSVEQGLLWSRRVAWVRFHADAASFDLIEKAGVSPQFLAALRPLDGRRFASPVTLYQALDGALGEGWFDAWNRELIASHGIGPWRPFHPQKGPVEAYEANGSLGQYIVVIPKARLVGVRQIREREEHPSSDDYPDFTERMQALADALVPAS